MRILTMTTPNVENGLGCRVTLWFAGCSHHCPGCHNQHTWAYDQGVNFLDEDVQRRIREEVSKSYIDGITLSGGDPLSQSDKSLVELKTFLETFRNMFPDKNVWIYAGDTYEEIIGNKYKLDVLRLCDVLVDGTFIKEKYDPDIAFRGSTNQRIIDVQKSLDSGSIIEIDIK